jgi:hypothetical protein
VSELSDMCLFSILFFILIIYTCIFCEYIIFCLLSPCHRMLIWGFGTIFASYDFSYSSIFANNKEVDLARHLNAMSCLY